MLTDSTWPFDQPRDCAVITLRSIALDGRPILLAFHDAEDHGWQFLDGGPFDPANAAIVGLGTIVRHDPSILELADLPPGWQAWRDSPTSPWQRSRTK